LNSRTTGNLDRMTGSVRESAFHSFQSLTAGDSMTFRKARCVFFSAAVVGALFFLATSVPAQPEDIGPKFLVRSENSG